jgi:hypothetical protein
LKEYRNTVASVLLCYTTHHIARSAGLCNLFLGGKCRSTLTKLYRRYMAVHTATAPADYIVAGKNLGSYHLLYMNLGAPGSAKRACLAAFTEIAMWLARNYFGVFARFVAQRKRAIV